MKGRVLIADRFAAAVLALALLGAALPGCALYPTESDRDAALYARVWETPRLDQQPVLFEFKTEGECDRAAARKDALDILHGSGKFRLATPEDEPAYKIEVTVAVRRREHVLKTVCNALILYAWPIDAEDYTCEVFADIREPGGKLIDHSYAQGRGRSELWLGYLFWPEWLRNEGRARAIRRDAVKAATTMMCRALMPEAKKE